MEDQHVQVLLENINHNIKTLGEGLAVLPEIRDDIKTLKEDVHQLKEDMIIVKQSLKNKADIARVEKIEDDVKVLQRKIA